MYLILHQYLVANRHLTLPGIGTWQLQEEPAKYEHTTQQLVPSRVLINFSADGENAIAVQPLIGYIAKSTGEPEEECFEQLHNFTASIKNSLDSIGTFDWPGFGTLQMQQENTVAFLPDVAIEEYTPALQAPRIVHEGQVHQMLVGDQETDTGTMQSYLQESELTETAVPPKPNRYWWIPALIGGTIGIILIIARLKNWW